MRWNNVLAYVTSVTLAHSTLYQTPVLQSQVLWFLGSVLPLGVQIVVNLLFVRSWWDLHHSALGCALLLFSHVR